LESTVLYFRDDAKNSNKQYRLALAPSGKKFVVEISFGKRDCAERSLQHKTFGPMSFAEAQAKYDAKLAEKLAEGYRVG
jgi:predicted DNA-binding WGR domain protein